MSVNNGIVSETGWDGSGGGYSAYYKIPSYQVGIVSNANRGVPDISANADPASGYNIYNSANGGMITVGGTSAVAPLIASLLLLANETLDTKLPFVNNNLYKLKGNSFIKDITCCTKWDPVTGLGVISSGQNFVLNILNPITIDQPQPRETSEPTETIDTSEPTETIDTSEPIETIDTSEPTETIDTSEPTETIDTSEPTEVIDTSEPIETSKLIEMSEPSSYAKDWVRAYIQTKDENPYTEKKKREKIENGPKNLTDRPVVEPPVIIRVSNSKNIK
jgi:subtilase family serine protease